jgi:hypothetical protein
MSGAALWAGERIVGVVSRHHPGDGPGRLAAARLDRTLPLDLPAELPDVVPASAANQVLTAYQELLADIAPERLYGRADELADLVRFCAGEPSYRWLQAGPWAGKSALLAWFARYPPRGVDVVSFFITSRYAGQSDSDAYTEAVLEQLTALAGETAHDVVRSRARPGHLIRLLRDAARRSRVAGRRLLLVVDGLDEDTSGADGDRPSIASLLPADPPEGVQVLVASRPHPELPDDVPGGPRRSGKQQHERSGVQNDAGSPENHPRPNEIGEGGERMGVPRRGDQSRRRFDQNAERQSRDQADERCLGEPEPIVLADGPDDGRQAVESRVDRDERGALFAGRRGGEPMPLAHGQAAVKGRPDTRVAPGGHRGGFPDSCESRGR